MQIQRACLVLVAGSAGLFAGCLPVSNYHSAKTLAEGESDFGLTFSSTTYSDPYDDPNDSSDGGSITLPGLVPELTYHIGVTDDLEVGGRIAPGFLYGEVDAKYRFFHAPRVHMAVAPALGQLAFIGTLTTLRLPLLLTYELSPRFAVTGGINGSVWKVSSLPDNDSGGPFAVGDDLFTTTGGSVGIEISGETAYFRPSFEFSTMVTDPGGDADRLKIAALVLHFGFIGGREKKQLDRIENKLDRLEQKAGLNWKQRTIARD
jgi:hypothetical protein